MVSEIGFGTWGISGNGYGPTDDKESEYALHTALDLGVSFIDTADIYGNGHSEKIIGKVLKERGDNQTIIATKFGWDFYRKGGVRSNLEKDYISFALEESLQRLRRDWIDIYQIHYSKPDSLAVFEVYDTLDELKKQGKIRYYGVSAYNLEDGQAAIKTGKPDTVQVAFNIFEQEPAINLFPLATENNMGIIVREPLACGLLTGKYTGNSVFPKADHRNGWSKKFLEERTAQVEKLKFLEKEDQTLIQSAIMFCLSNNAISTVIPGAKLASQVVENTVLKHVVLAPSEIKKIKKLFGKVKSVESYSKEIV